MISSQLLVSPQLTLLGDAEPRMLHSATALSLGPGWTQVTMFGGCPKWDGEKPNALPKLAKTSVLEFGEQTTHDTDFNSGLLLIAYS